MDHSSDDLPPGRRIHCNSCNQQTNHTCLAQHFRLFPPEIPEEFEDDPEFDPDMVPRDLLGFRMWVCDGCDRAILEEFWGFVMDTDYNSIADGTNYINYFPQRSAGVRPENHYDTLPSTIRSIYHEVNLAFNSGLRLLCAMGIRALLEAICADQQTAGRTLAQKIDGLAPPIPVHIVQNLHTLRFLGNEAAHDFTVPDDADLSLAIGVCEDILNFFYQLNYRATQLAARRQARNLATPPHDPPG